jgi:hypothetical protein
VKAAFRPHKAVPASGANANRDLDGKRPHHDHVIPHRAGRRSDHPSRPAELVKPPDMPAGVLIKWPPARSVVEPNPKALASVAASVVRVLGEAQAALAKMGCVLDVDCGRDPPTARVGTCPDGRKVCPGLRRHRSGQSVAR